METLGERVHERLRGAVGDVAGQRLEAGQGADVEDGSRPAGHHVREERGDEIEHGVDVDQDLLALALGVEPLEPTVRPESRVVAEPDDEPAVRLDVAHQLGPRRGVREVARAHVDPGAVRVAQFVRQRVQPLAAARNDGHGVAALREPSGELCSGTRGGACHQAQ